MAKSRSKYTRARIRARGRRTSRRGGSNWFYGAMALIVILGVAGIALAKPDNSSAAPQPGNPSTGAPGDHWHAALGANLCGDWLDTPPEFLTAAANPNVNVGIHTHGDGFVHIEPNTPSEGGDNATFGRFLANGGWDVTEDSLSLWSGPPSVPKQASWSNGDKCPPGTPFAGRAGVVKWSVDCVAKSGNPSDLKLAEHQVIAVAFLPKSESIGVPPNANTAPASEGGAELPALNVKGCSTTGPGATATTAAAGATTDSTSAAETSTTTP